MSSQNSGNGVRKSVSDGARYFLESEMQKMFDSISAGKCPSVAVEYLDALSWIEKLLEAGDDKK